MSVGFRTGGRLFRLLQPLLQFDAIAHEVETPLLHCSTRLQPACLAAAGREEGGSAMSMVLNAKMQDRRRSRPLTAMQERLFFGALFVIAALVQVAAVWVQIVR
jgi:hypothetical protein